MEPTMFRARRFIRQFFLGATRCFKTFFPTKTVIRSRFRSWVAGSEPMLECTGGIFRTGIGTRPWKLKKYASWQTLQPKKCSLKVLTMLLISLWRHFLSCRTILVTSNCLASMMLLNSTLDAANTAHRSPPSLETWPFKVKRPTLESCLSATYEDCRRTETFSSSFTVSSLLPASLRKALIISMKYVRFDGSLLCCQILAQSK